MTFSNKNTYRTRRKMKSKRKDNDNPCQSTSTYLSHNHNTALILWASLPEYLTHRNTRATDFHVSSFKIHSVPFGFYIKILWRLLHGLSLFKKKVDIFLDFAVVIVVNFHSHSLEKRCDVFFLFTLWIYNHNIFEFYQWQYFHLALIQFLYFTEGSFCIDIFSSSCESVSWPRRWEFRRNRVNQTS